MAFVLPRCAFRVPPAVRSCHSTPDRQPLSHRQGAPGALAGLFSGWAVARFLRLRGLRSFSEAVEVDVALADSEVQFQVLEASLDWQEDLIEEAVEQEDEAAVEADPYGMAVWPAAQVLGQAAAAYGLKSKSELTALELGCGCGLASLALLSLGAHVVATDFRELPLRLLSESASRQGWERLRVQLLDLRGAEPLPAADLVLASDVLYDKATAEAMAVRVAEARARGSAVLVADIGRPNRRAFLERLRELRPQEDCSFSCHGLARQHLDAQISDTRVELLELPKDGPAKEALAAWPAALLSRPPNHGHVL